MVLRPSGDKHSARAEGLYDEAVSDSDDSVPPTSGWAFIVFGVIVAAIGWLVLAFPDDAPPESIGFGLLGVGSLLCTIGSVAVGVTMGFARADYLRQR